MPVYEYWCNNCKTKVEIYLPRFDSEVPSCPKCQAGNLERRFSTFRTHKTYKDVYDGILSDNQLTRGMMNSDPKALAEWNKRMSGGAPVSPEYQEPLDRMAHGEQQTFEPFEDMAHE